MRAHARQRGSSSVVGFCLVVWVCRGVGAKRVSILTTLEFCLGASHFFKFTMAMTHNDSRVRRPPRCLFLSRGTPEACSRTNIATGEGSRQRKLPSRSIQVPCGREGSLEGPLFWRVRRNSKEAKLEHSLLQDLFVKDRRCSRTGSLALGAFR